MALTRPKFRQVDSGTISVSDPITVLQGGATSANVDVGFVINRASGLVNNVAIYWNETLKSFTTAYTTSAGASDSNISVSSYAPITASKVYLTDALLWAANGNSMIAGSAITVSSTSPANPSIGDRWYDPTTDVMYEFFNDGTSTYWIDIYSSFATTTTLSDTALGGNLIPTANATYNVGSSTSFWKDFYIGGNVQLNGSRVTSSSAAGVTITNKLTATDLIATSGTSSTSTSTGALQVSGGAGVTGNLYSGSVYTTTIYTDNYKYANGQPFISTTLANTAEITANATGGSSVGFSLVATGVTAGNYGSATSIPTIVVDSKGRITSLTSNAVSTTINLAGTSGTGSVAGGGTLTFAGTYGVTATASSSTITVGTPQDLQTSASPSFNNGTFAGNVNIAGKLTVANLEARGSVSAVVQDPMLYLQANVLYPWSYDTGIYSDSIGGPANTYVHHGMVRNTNNAYWGFFSNVKTEPDAGINWSDAGLIWDKIKVGDIVLANTTAASSTTSGALQVAGGAGIAGATYVGGLLNVTGATTLTTATTGGLQAVAIGNATPGTGAFTTLSASGITSLTNSTASTSSSTGALVVSGGVGIAGDVYQAAGKGIYGGVTASGNGDANQPYKLSSDYNAWASIFGPSWTSANGWGIFWAGNQDAAYGTNGNGASNSGPGNIWSNSTNPNELVMVGGGATQWTCNLSDGRTWQRGALYCASDVYSSYSDIRLKTIVGYIEDPIALLKQLEVFYYEPNEEALKLGATPGRKVGVSAQSALKVQPETVGKSALGKDYLTVQYERLVPLLVETCKKQQDMIEKLQEEVANLKNGIQT